MGPSSWNDLPQQLLHELLTLPLSVFGNAGRLPFLLVVALTWDGSASESLSGAI